MDISSISANRPPGLAGLASAMAPMERIPGAVMRTLLVLPSLAVTRLWRAEDVTMPVRLSQTPVLLQGGGFLALHRLQFSFARDRERQGVIQPG